MTVFGFTAMVTSAFQASALLAAATKTVSSHTFSRGFSTLLVGGNSATLKSSSLARRSSC